MKNYKVTVVTVTYNCADSIEKTIKSVIEQEYVNIEYIIVDGMSKDSTLEIVEKYRDKIARIVSEKDEGIYDAMNKAISFASGDWILFMNSGDTFVDSHVVEKCFSCNLDDYAAVYGSWYSVRNNQLVHIPCNMPFWKSTKRYKGMGFSHQSVFVKLEWARKYKFDLSYKCCADYNMIYSIFKDGGRFFCANIPIAIYDGIGGFSDKHRTLQRKEHARILGIENTIYFILFNMKEELKSKIKKISKIK